MKGRWPTDNEGAHHGGGPLSHAPLVAYMLVVAALSVLKPPAEAAPAIAGVDKAAHFIVYGVMGFLAARSIVPSRAAKGAVIAAVAVFIFGLLMECAQLFIPYRSFELLDAAANGAGGAAGAFLYAFWTNRRYGKGGGR